MEDEVASDKSALPVWLIQNEMCAKPWLPLERITEENTKQRTQAARMFNTVSRAFKQVYANLGKADSAIFDDSLGDGLRWNLLRESQFGSLEQNIRYDLIRKYRSHQAAQLHRRRGTRSSNHVGWTYRNSKGT